MKKRINGLRIKSKKIRGKEKKKRKKEDNTRKIIK